MIGKINSKIDDFLEGIVQSFDNNNNDQRSKICREFSDSTEYKSISFSFRSPVRCCQKLDSIKGKIQKIDNIKQDADFIRFWGNLKPVLNKYLESYKPEWDRYSYLIIPVMVNDAKAGLTYITAGTYQPGESNRLSYSGLPTKEVDYKTLAELVLKELYLVTHWYFGAPSENENFIKNYYKLYFNAGITEGKSMSAAVVALFCIEFCRNYLGKSDFDAYAAPLNGLFITGVVSADGKISVVENVADKILGAIDEFGAEIKIILPKNSQLPEDFKINKSNLIYVETVTDLFEAVLSSHNPNKGLNNIRIKLFEKLSQDQKDICKQHLINGIGTDIYDKLGFPGYNQFDNIRQKENIFYTSGCNQKTIKFNLSLKRGLLETNNQPGLRSSFFVILDGSNDMNSFWQVKAPEVISKMADIVYEIQKKFDFPNNDLYIGFLSSGMFTNLTHSQESLPIHLLIDNIRKRDKLETRGAYLRPVYEAVKANYSNKNLKVLIISDSIIYDFDDLKSRRLFQIDRRHLMQSGKDNILDNYGKPDLPALEGYFNKPNESSFKEIKIHLGNYLPLSWHPYDGSMEFVHNEGYSVKYTKINDQLFKFECCMAYTSPQMLKIECRIDSEINNEPKISIDDVLLSKGIKPEYESYTEIRLSNQDFLLWQTLCNHTGICSCGRGEVHLDHTKNINRAPVFHSVTNYKDSFLLCLHNSDTCYLFKTGIRIGEINIVYLNDNLYFSISNVDIRPFQTEGGIYRFTNNSSIFYACKF